MDRIGTMVRVARQLAVGILTAVVPIAIGL